MSEDRGVTRLLARIACEQDVFNQLAAGIPRLRATRQAKRDLAGLDAADLRPAEARQHAASEASA